MATEKHRLTFEGTITLIFDSLEATRFKNKEELGIPTSECLEIMSKELTKPANNDYTMHGSVIEQVIEDQAIIIENNDLVISADLYGVEFKFKPEKQSGHHHTKTREDEITEMDDDPDYDKETHEEARRFDGEWLTKHGLKTKMLMEGRLKGNLGDHDLIETRWANGTKAK